MYTAIKSFFHFVLYTPLYNILIFFAWLIPGHSIGWAIILLTVVIRLILLPNSIKATKAQMKLQALQPKMNEIKKKYKDDQAAQSQALMAMYKEEGTSPFGSCLPQLVQLPILWILYRVFRDGLSTQSFSLLYSFTPHPEIINTSFFGLDLTQPEKWILPILAGLAQLVLSLMMMPKTPKDPNAEPDPAQMMQKQMIFLFPVMNFVFARMFPAALALYWVATTVFSIGQQWYVNKTIKKEVPFGSSTSPQPSPRPSTVSARSGQSNCRRGEGVSSIPSPIPTCPSGRRVGEGQGEGNDKRKPKKDFMGRIMDNRLKKAEKKSDVSVTIRKKK